MRRRSTKAMSDQPVVSTVTQRLSSVILVYNGCNCLANVPCRDLTEDDLKSVIAYYNGDHDAATYDHLVISSVKDLVDHLVASGVFSHA